MLTLSNLKQYLKTKPQVTLFELSKYFEETPDIVQDHMRHFIHKGHVCESTLTPKCGSVCQKCDVKNIVVYRWQH